MVVFISLCGCNGAEFRGVATSCQASYESAWGHPAARKHALKLLEASSTCPSTRRLSVRGQAAFIGANLYRNTEHACYDDVLAAVLEEKCGPAWASEFKFDLWHAHAEGVRMFVENHRELALMVALSVLVAISPLVDGVLSVA